MQDSLNESSVRPNGTPVFYVPGKLRSFSSFFLVNILTLLASGKHRPEERKIPIGPIHIVFLLGPTWTSFSFPPAGTPPGPALRNPAIRNPVLVLLGPEIS